MSAALLRRGILAFAVFFGCALSATAQQPAKPQGFPTADAAASAFTEAVRGKDLKTVAAIWGPEWRDFMPIADDEMQRRRAAYLTAWDESHKLVMSGDNKAVIEVGRSGWTLPVPIVKDGSEWHFDVAAGLQEIALRRIGYDERAVIQTMLAIVDAQNDYAALDPMKTGSPVYARRLLSSQGKKDGLYWETKPGEPLSPLGPALARAQVDTKSPDGYFGYQFRLLYAQGAAAQGGARDYILGGRMIGGFGVIAWPVRYGATGVMTFIVNQKGVVYQRDLGPQTAERAAAITSFNPDQDWAKADTSPP
jgi:hypothetical protein